MNIVQEKKLPLKHTRSFLAAGLLAFATAPLAHASLLSYDSFSDYTINSNLQATSPSPTISGYSGNWTQVDFGNAQFPVLSSSLTYGDSNYLGSTGGSVSVANNTSGGEITSSNSGRLYRLFDSTLTATSTTETTLYFSFLFQSGQETGATTYQMVSFYDGSTADAVRNFDIGLTTNGSQPGTQYNFGVDNAYTSTGVAADTDVHLMVVKFDLVSASAGDMVTVWVDPLLSSVGDPSGGTSVSGKDITFDRLTLSDYDGNSAVWDEFRFGTTFADVAVSAVPESSSYAFLAGLGTLALVSARRRRTTV